MSLDTASSTLMYVEGSETGSAVARMLRENATTVKRLARHLKANPPSSVMTLARGSSDNATTYGRYLMEDAVGVLCASAGLSPCSIYESRFHAPGCLCIAASQSGASPDLLSAAGRAKEGGALVVGMINTPGSPLEDLCDEVIYLSAGPERSVAATKSFVCTLAAFALLTVEWSGNRQLRDAITAIPEALDRAWKLEWSSMSDVLKDASNLFVLGRGPGLGIAQEAALKLKETAGLHAEAFSAAEVMHGPLALVVPGFPVLSFVQSDASYDTSCATAGRLAERGARVLIAGGFAAGATRLPTIPSHRLLEPLVTILPFYRAAANLSILRGFDPDRPPHLTKETHTL